MHGIKAFIRSLAIIVATISFLILLPVREAPKITDRRWFDHISTNDQDTVRFYSISEKKSNTGWHEGEYSVGTTQEYSSERMLVRFDSEDTLTIYWPSNHNACECKFELSHEDLLFVLTLNTDPKNGYETSVYLSEE